MLKRGGKSTLIETLTHEDKELELESGLEKLLTPQPFTGQIHVLVVIPEHLSEPSAHKKQRLEWRSTRPAFHSQFEFLREKILNEGHLGWILGRPGT
ncbi:hypothetical protein PC114_g20951 [Phytophthora cactorum]|nr:hypothetical protein PC114_g20951 [Phytophthora cactorum]